MGSYSESNIIAATAERRKRFKRIVERLLEEVVLEGEAVVANTARNSATTKNKIVR